jgi:hypothetical protein
MIRCTLSIAVLVLAASCASSMAQTDYPEPSPYLKTWQLDFDHGKPKRVVVQTSAMAAPKAYWYLTYTVTNHTDQEQLFMPSFDLVTEDGKIVHSDTNIPKTVFDVIKKREGMRFLETAAQIAGELRIGDDQAKDGVAIWPEPSARMGHFQIYVSGLSGEIAMIKGPDGKDQILRKTLQLNYLIRGDEVYPGEDQVNEEPEKWVMR